MTVDKQRVSRSMSGIGRGSIPQNRIPLVVGRTGCVNALVASSHVETHAIRATAHVLLQALIYI